MFTPFETLTYYQVLFLFLLGINLLLFWMRSKGNFFGFINRQAFMSLFSFLALFGLIVAFLVMMFGFDPRPYARQLGAFVGSGKLVDYGASIPENLESTLNVKDVIRLDTDGDGFDEWVVFYGQNDQISAVIYDNDRGNPPVIFPYSLRSPNNEYLSVGEYNIETDNISSDNTNVMDVVIRGYPKMPFGIPVGADATDLTIFRHVEPVGDVWADPTDSPPRYEPVGRFHGDGGVQLDTGNKNVTTINKQQYARSQLALRQVYILDKNRKSYMSETNLTLLAPPTVSTLDFYPNPPEDIKAAAFPEQVVLAFYASLCSAKINDDFCRHYDFGWNTADFLDGDAMNAYNQDGLSYFGLPNKVSQLSIHSISPDDTQPIPTPTPASENEQPNPTSKDKQPPPTSKVTITFTAEGQKMQTAQYTLQYTANTWKIIRRDRLETATIDQP